MKQDNCWARTDQEKANTFAEHSVTPNAREIDFEESCF